MRGVGPVVAALVAVMAVGGCSSSGGDDSSPGSAGSSTTAPEDITTTAAEVAAGLAKLSTLAGQIAVKTAADPASGQAAADGLEPLWQPIEGTVKKNDADTYLTIEDAFANLESGDATKAASGAQDLASAVTNYLIDYPG
ncbi:MAG: hypothetical protein QOH89_1625 [Pseudonocardiales bacterium]|nr:hypothetical protein [Pseudonocardiales bacterium]